jgi:hypothetical protein
VLLFIETVAVFHAVAEVEGELLLERNFDASGLAEHVGDIHVFKSM